MGNVGSRPDEGAAVYLKEQTRFSVAGVNITNARGRVLLNTSPNAFPATRYNAKREAGDDNLVDYVPDPDTPLGSPPSFILRLSNEEELSFTFTCVIRQQPTVVTPQLGDQVVAVNNAQSLDTQINGLTFVFGTNAREVDQLITREFHADPNLHKNANVELLGDFATGGTPSAQFQWSWKWRPPKQFEDRGGGWRNTCSFVEYDQRAHKLDTLATFTFWVQNAQRYLSSPIARSPGLEPMSPPRLRVPSAQSIESRVSHVSDSDVPPDFRDLREPVSPMIESIPEYGLGLVPTMTNGPEQGRYDIACVGRPGEDLVDTEDGPVFRATMRDLERKTATMKSRMKRVLETAQRVEAAQHECNKAASVFMEALRDASTTNSNAVRPALDHYFDSIAKEILTYERENNIYLKNYIIEPISKLYRNDIKQADNKRKEFDDGSKVYYDYMGKFLAKSGSVKEEKKRMESDAKYQAKRRTFELKRFDYSSFMHDLNGGRKEQEVLSQLTKYAEAQARGYLRTAHKVEEMMPQLDALTREVNEVDKEFQMQRTEREEKRRALETNNKSSDGESSNGGGIIERHTSMASSMANALRGTSLSTSPSSAISFLQGSSASGPGFSIASTIPTRHASNKFKGIRDLEDKDPSSSSSSSIQHRKEGLLWSLNRPGSHVDPIMSKAAWHKFWVVLDQGRLSEYANWKDKLDLHMEPIDLRVASVREARNADRRFCFEVITPQFTRVYQAPSEDDMKSWIAAINNALQSAFESRPTTAVPEEKAQPSSTRNTIAAVLTGKSTSFSGHRQSQPIMSYPSSAGKSVSRHATTGDKPTYLRADSGESPSHLLKQVRDADAGNNNCADCGSDQKVEWVSINLGIVLCIECSGIHRSLGTHISKVRSLTLDTSAFTPDIIDLLLLIGNRVSNMIWEARLDLFLKPSPHSTREQRLHFINAKYNDRTYVQPLALTNLSHFLTPDETLLASIKKNDIQNVLFALALGANPNSTDRMRATHAVYLALAAADPAAPGAGSMTSWSHSRASSMSSLTPPLSAGHTTASMTRPVTPALSRKPFAVAELLLQNGADIPRDPAPIPLSPAARQYLEFKIDQRTGRHFGAGVTDGGGDRISALPSIAAGNGGSPRDREKERERERDRLMKRSSVGGGAGGGRNAGEREGGSLVGGMVRR